MIENIKRGLGVLTKLDWITQVPEIRTQEIKVDVIDSIKELSISGSVDTTISLADNLKGTLFITITTDENELTKTRLHIRSGKNNDIHLVVNINNKSQAHITSHLLEVEENSSVLWFLQTNGTRQVVCEQKALLVGTNSTVKTIATTFGSEGNNFDMSTISEHVAAHSTSDILFRSVLEGSKVLARGLVKIGPKAYQNSNIILVDKKARAITIPDLEIQNKDVSCSHGSTITSIDELKIFYLQSRGLNKEEAKQTIIKGFIDDLYSDLDKAVVAQLRGEVDDE
jgi:Fe-S cluster assembly scaffold protein SufB